VKIESSLNSLAWTKAEGKSSGFKKSNRNSTKSAPLENASSESSLILLGVEAAIETQIFATKTGALHDGEINCFIRRRLEESCFGCVPFSYEFQAARS
jgi:hypothetical protein